MRPLEPASPDQKALISRIIMGEEAITADNYGALKAALNTRNRGLGSGTDTEKRRALHAVIASSEIGDVITIKGDDKTWHFYFKNLNKAINRLSMLKLHVLTMMHSGSEAKRWYVSQEWSNLLEAGQKDNDYYEFFNCFMRFKLSYDDDAVRLQHFVPDCVWHEFALAQDALYPNPIHCYKTVLKKIIDAGFKDAYIAEFSYVLLACIVDKYSWSKEASKQRADANQDRRDPDFQRIAIDRVNFLYDVLKRVNSYAQLDQLAQLGMDFDVPFYAGIKRNTSAHDLECYLRPISYRPIEERWTDFERNLMLSHSITNWIINPNNHMPQQLAQRFFEIYKKISNETKPTDKKGMSAQHRFSTLLAIFLKSYLEAQGDFEGSFDVPEKMSIRDFDVFGRVHKMKVIDGRGHCTGFALEMVRLLSKLKYNEYTVFQVHMLLVNKLFKVNERTGGVALRIMRKQEVWRENFAEEPSNDPPETIESGGLYFIGVKTPKSSHAMILGKRNENYFFWDVNQDDLADVKKHSEYKDQREMIAAFLEYSQTKYKHVPHEYNKVDQGTLDSIERLKHDERLSPAASGSSSPAAGSGGGGSSSPGPGGGGT